MEKFFKPKDLLILGVSEKPDNLAAIVLANCLLYGFKGEIYLYGREAGELQGKKIETQFEAFPDNIDLAVILTPAPVIPFMLEACGKKGIHRVIIESAGFGEKSKDRQDLEKELLKLAKQYDIRIIGPNGIGTIDNYHGTVLPFGRFEARIKQGGISIIAQSGGVGVGSFFMLHDESLGLSKFVSVGNKLDINEADLLEYFLSDPETDCIYMYLESIVNGRRLYEIASRAQKPILIHKSNRTRQGSQTAFSHTKALSNDDQIVAAAFRQAGILRIDAVKDTPTGLKAFHFPLMRGNRVAMISRSGGHSVIATDAIEKAGFVLPPFSEKTVQMASQFVRAGVIHLQNPLDVGDIFDFSLYYAIIEHIIQNEDIAGIVFINVYRPGANFEAEKSRVLLPQLKALSLRHQKPIIPCFLTTRSEVSFLQGSFDYPLFDSPEEAIKALRYSYDYFLAGERREKRQQERQAGESLTAEENAIWPKHECSQRPFGKTAGSKAHAVPSDEGCRLQFLDESQIPSCYGNAGADASGALSEKGGALELGTALKLLKQFQIPVAPYGLAADATQAVVVAKQIGFPVALKVIAPQIVHKTEFNAIRLQINSEKELFQAVADINRSIAKKDPAVVLTGYQVQKMVTGGLEVIVGARNERDFGPIVLFGMGGIYTELFQDVAIKLAPLTTVDIEALIFETTIGKALNGFRGMAPRDTDSLMACLNQVSRLIVAHPEIQELDLNPVMVLEKGKGVCVVDVRLRGIEKDESEKNR